MDNDQMTVLIIRGAIAEMNSDDQERVAECADKLRLLVRQYADFGRVALALVGAEEAIGDGNDLA